MIAVMSTVNRTRVTAVELGKVNGFLTDSGGRTKRWWIRGGGGGEVWLLTEQLGGW